MLPCVGVASACRLSASITDAARPRNYSLPRRVCMVAQLVDCQKKAQDTQDALHKKLLASQEQIAELKVGRRRLTSA